MKFAIALDLLIYRMRVRDRRRCHTGMSNKPFAVEKLCENHTASVAQSLEDQPCDSLHETPPDNLSLSDKWSALRDCLLSSAETTIGRCHRKQPDWYCDSSSVLTPLLELRNKSYADWVAHGRQNDDFYDLFKSARQAAHAAVRCAQTVV